MPAAAPVGEAEDQPTATAAGMEARSTTIGSAQHPSVRTVVRTARNAGVRTDIDSPSGTRGTGPMRGPAVSGRW